MWMRTKAGLESVCASFMAFSVIFVSLRLYARKYQHLPFQADDVFAVLGVVSSP